MKNNRNQKCPKCGKKNKVCRCKSGRNKYLTTMLFIVFLAVIAGCFANSAKLYYYSRPFYAVLNSLPDEKVKSDYYNLLDQDKLKLGLITGEMQQAAMYDKKNQALEINLKAFKSWEQNMLWCVLVHEHGHIYGDGKILEKDAENL